jgi:lipopolysaccharide biosynthesis regulator YciM
MIEVSLAKEPSLRKFMDDYLLIDELKELKKMKKYKCEQCGFETENKEAFKYHECTPI